MRTTEPGRRAAHVLLDCATAYSPDDPEETQGRMIQLAMNGLTDTNSVTATYDDETDTANVDVSGLAGGLMILVHTLVERVALETGLSREEVIAQHREIIDHTL